MRKLTILCGLALVLIGGVSAWRALHPSLNDSQQIEAALTDMKHAVKNGQTRRLVDYLAPEFQWRDYSRDFIQKNFGGFSLQWRDAELHLADVKVRVEGESAISDGSFTLIYRNRGTPNLETRAGHFQLFWEKRDEKWLVVKADGGENIEP